MGPHLQAHTGLGFTACALWSTQPRPGSSPRRLTLAVVMRPVLCGLPGPCLDLKPTDSHWLGYRPCVLGNTWPSPGPAPTSSLGTGLGGLPWYLPRCGNLRFTLIRPTEPVLCRVPDRPWAQHPQAHPDLGFQASLCGVPCPVPHPHPGHRNHGLLLDWATVLSSVGFPVPSWAQEARLTLAELCGSPCYHLDLEMAGSHCWATYRPVLYGAPGPVLGPLLMLALCPLSGVLALLHPRCLPAWAMGLFSVECVAFLAQLWTPQCLRCSHCPLHS